MQKRPVGLIKNFVFLSSMPSGITGADDMAENILPQLLHGHIRLMLGRNYNSVHPCRDFRPGTPR